MIVVVMIVVAMLVVVMVVIMVMVVITVVIVIVRWHDHAPACVHARLPAHGRGRCA